MALDPHINPASGVWDDNYFANKNKSVASSGGGFDVGNFMKTQQDRQDALVASQKADTAARFAQGKSDVSDFMGRYNTAVPGLFDTTEAKYNVPFWKTTASAIGNRIDELRGNTNNAGGGGLTSADQVDKAIGTNLLPRYAQATNTANTASGLAQSEYGAKIAPYETEGKMLTDRLARESTGYSTQQQGELDALIKSIQSGTTLGAAQMQRATALADQENQKLIAEEQIAQKNAELKKQVTVGYHGEVVYRDANGQLHIVSPTGGGGGSAYAGS